MSLDRFLCEVFPLIFGAGFLLETLNAIYGIRAGMTITVFLKLTPDDSDYQKVVSIFKMMIYRYWPVAVVAALSLADRKGWIEIGRLNLTISHNFLFALLILFNWNRTGFNLWGIGGFLNSFVCALNGGSMPVLGILDEYSKNHQPMDLETRLPILGDWIEVGNVLASPGDLLLWYGGLLFFLYQLGLLAKKKPWGS